MKISWKNSQVGYGLFEDCLSRCIGDYHLFSKKEFMQVAASTLSKINVMYYKIEDSFGTHKEGPDRNKQWELLQLVIRIKELINLEEREAEWLVIAIMQVENSNSEWVVGKPIEMINKIISQDRKSGELLNGQILEEDEDSDKHSQEPDN